MIRITLHDIAKKAGVSVATVSLALRGRGDISLKRAEEIRALAQTMGYRPNPLLASLASKRFSGAKSLQGTPLAIFEFPTQPGQTEPTTSMYHGDLLQEAKRLGYAPAHHMAPTAEQASRLYRQLYSRSVQGIIVTGSVDMEGFGKAFDWEPFSIVQCARYKAEYPFHTVRANIFQSIKLVFTQLRQRGYQRIGFALGRHESLLEDDEDRHGAAISLEMAYLPRKDRLPAYLGSLDDQKAFLAWFRTHRPDAVVGFSGAHYWFLREAGVRIPRDTGFVVLHRPARSEVDYAGLDQNNQEIACQSIQLLDQLIRNHERGLAEHPRHLLIPSTWSDGKTLRTRPGAAKA